MRAYSELSPGIPECAYGFRGRKRCKKKVAALGHGIIDRGGRMLRWALIFFVVALIAAAFGFLGIASAAVGVARLLFYIFLILFLVSLVSGLTRRTL